MYLKLDGVWGCLNRKDYMICSTSPPNRCQATLNSDSWKQSTEIRNGQVRIWTLALFLLCNVYIYLSVHITIINNFLRISEYKLLPQIERSCSFTGKIGTRRGYTESVIFMFLLPLWRNLIDSSYRSYQSESFSFNTFSSRTNWNADIVFFVLYIFYSRRTKGISKKYRLLLLEGKQLIKIMNCSLTLNFDCL